MDLSKLLNGPGDPDHVEDEENAGGAKEGQWRDRLYKRKGINFTTTARENRTLRSMQVHDRRKSSRQSQQIAGRGIEDLDILEENDENVDTENNRNARNKKTEGQKVEPVKEPAKSKSRRDRLAEYLEQKKKLEDRKRKMAKPAFKVGVVHHPVAPIGAGFHKPNLFSTNQNSSKCPTPSTPRVAQRPAIRPTKAKASRPVTTTASVTGRVTRSKAAGVKADSKAKEKNVVPTQRSTVFPAKQPKTQKPAAKIVGASFAPDNFEFKLSIPLEPVTEENQESPNNKEEEGPKASTPVSNSNKKEKTPKSLKVETTPKIQKKESPLKPEDETVKSPISPEKEVSPNTPEKEKSPVQTAQAPLPVTPEPVVSRGRRRSRRMSGVQPDPSLTQEELCLTPAKRAKDRSASRDRRQSQCQMCPGDNHTCATPRATPRISRMSTLPSLSEADTSANDGKVEELSSKSRSSRRASEVPLPVTEKKRNSRRSNVQAMEVEDGSNSSEPDSGDVLNTPDKLVNLARMAVDVPLPTTEKKGRSRRSLQVQPMEVEAIAEADIEADTPVTNLSKSMDRASIESAKKEPTFKTPMKAARLAGVKSSVKATVSPVPTGASLNNVNTSRGSSKRKRKESPASNSLVLLFENLEGSPLLTKLEEKAMSNENITEADFDEIPVAKQMKLDKDFEEIAVEESQQSINVESGEEKKHDIPYFRNLVVSETVRLTSVCDGWDKKFEENLEKMSEDIQGEVRTVIGQGRLVMSERFTQFSGLVDNCEFKRGEKETTCTDLMGFWEMIYFQVEDVEKKFEKLREIESNNWTEVVVKPVFAKKKMVKKAAVGAGSKKVASSGLKALIAAKRKAAEEAKAALTVVEDVKPVEEMVNQEIEASEPNEEPATTKRLNIKEMIAKKRAQLAKEKEEKEVTLNTEVSAETVEEKMDCDERTFDGGFFSVKSPVRSNPSSKESSPQAPQTPASSEKSRRSMVAVKLRRAVLTESARRVSGLVSPFVSQVARRSLQGSDTSPYKDAKSSSLFDDMDADKSDTTKESQQDQPTASLIELFDPIAPLSSPVTKTYSKSGTSPAANRRQNDAFDQMIIGTSPKVDSCYFEPSTPKVNFTDNVELISFDSPVEPFAVVQTDSPVSTGGRVPKTPATQSKIPVKAPARRSIRGKTPKKV
eukprot:GFUD01018391.1.p1 GENE.GFUD01018391.1~~GFUD01018391.1.p1  ORF type:complete len:1165 (+),score=384.52 GFUD01018391.1:49-3543(+)